jgi:ABC-type sugar transport system permease subunit
VALYYEGEKCEDYYFDVDLSDIRDNGTTQHLYLNIGLQFTDATNIEEYILYFGFEPKGMKYASKVDINGVPHPVQVDDLFVEFVSIDSDGVVLEKEVVWNPLKKILIWTSIIIVSVLLLSIIFSRLLTPTVKVSRIAITGAYHKQLTVRGYSMVVLTSTRKKQSFLNKLYKGRILYEVNPTWHSDVTISPRNNKSVTMRYDANSYSCNSRVLEKGGTYTLNDLKERTKIEIRVI